MFDIGWSELVVIAIVALIAIGPKELPGVLRMVGQWMAKARRMASDFQGQFNEAMREAEMADIKKQFDDVSATANDLSPTNLLSSMGKDVEGALKIDAPASEPSASPTTQAPDAKAS
jgi:sec-independent protein translocase protein TatB